MTHMHKLDPSKLTQSAKAYLVNGCYPSTIRFITESKFKIPEEFQDCFSSYHLVAWNSTFFLQKSVNLHGFLFRDNMLWRIIYLTPRGIIKQHPETDVLLSFRRPKEEFGIIPTVLVKLGSR